MTCVSAWPGTVDAGRCSREGHSGGATGPFSGCRSGAAGRAQAGAWVAGLAAYSQSAMKGTPMSVIFFVSTSMANCSRMFCALGMCTNVRPNTSSWE